MGNKMKNIFVRSGDTGYKTHFRLKGIIGQEMESVIIVWKRKVILTMIGGDLTILMVLFSKDKGTNISEMKNKITRQFQE